MLFIVVLIPGLVGQAPMAALAALMIKAGISAIDPVAVKSIWNTGWSARLPMVVTFITVLFFSIPIAVGIGVILSILLYVGSSSTDIQVYQLVRLADGSVREQEPPAKLISNQVTALDVSGSLFFAGARILEERLPSPVGSENPVVILRLRGQPRVGSTFLSVIDKYSDQLAAVNGKLYLSGVDEEVYKQIQRSHELDLAGPVSVYMATATRGESSKQAYADAMAWSISRRNGRETAVSPNA
jgi:SulP family sulfate permease